MRRAMLALLLPVAACAQTQPEIDYMLHCRGCHGPDGAAHSKVPALREGLGTLMRTQGGRQYIVRVPGVARSALDDDRLAALLNWLLQHFTPEVDRPYTAAEVRPLRASPLLDPVAERARLTAQHP